MVARSVRRPSTASRKRSKGYGEGFERVRRLVDERDAVQATLDEVGPRIIPAITKILERAEANEQNEVAFLAGVLLRDILQARLQVFRYLNTNDEADLDVAVKNFEVFRKHMQELDAKVSDTALHDELVTIQNYVDTYEQASKTSAGH